MANLTNPNPISMEEFQDQLKRLREVYAAQLPEKIGQIEAKWQALQNIGESEWNEWGEEEFKALHRLTHNLTGSGGAFGYPNLSQASRQLELLLNSIIESGKGDKPPTSKQKTQITELLKALRRAAATPDQSHQSASLNPKEDKMTKDVPSPSPLPSEPLARHEPEAENKLVFLVEDDPYLLEDLKLQISHFGYTVRAFRQTSSLKEAVNETPPAAIIIDIMLPEGRYAGPKVIAEIQAGRQKPIPVIFISIRKDLSARLEAIRAGGHAYFTKPVDIRALIDKLDVLSGRYLPEPYRILIVDDDAILAAHYSLTLRQAGMIPSTVIDLMQVTQALDEFKPDLILMDIYMPKCNGIELTSAIRQDEAYVDIPIIYLSTETDFDKQLAAINQGADDFLTKPIQPEQLISAVSSHAQRARILRTFMISDSLTGLMKHTKIKELLRLEVERAKRQRVPFSYAMIDIDRFKLVNDTYGHATGDRVIKGLSLLLKQRLRKTDIIGRYGGEEFAVILLDTDGAKAFKVLDEIRESFANIRQQTESGEEFRVSFSGGVASFPQHSDPVKIGEAADRALYEAKRQGRNRVV